ncbi:MAG: DNA topoisomerase IB [Chloroflexota bacterium]
MDTQLVAEEANLRYVSSDMQGYTRKIWGRGFTYQDADGETIHNDDLRTWFENLVIPPAWTEVWISPYKNGHILATGRDDAGRKQYIYHPRWQEVRSRKKFDELIQFAQVLPLIRQTVDQNLRKHKLSREKVLSTIVLLLEKTLIRIGNEHYKEKNNSYGLTTLEDDHVEIKGSKVIFEFTGKHDKDHQIILSDRRLARNVKRCRDLPGYELFQYEDEEGNQHVVDSADVNNFLKEITRQDITAKTFRTWGGSSLAIQVLCEDIPDDLEIDQHAKWCIECVADSLGNTIAVCRDYYIDPRIFKAYEAGELCELYQSMSTNEDKYSLNRAEQCLVKLLS